jgi:hypothetical protein
MDKTPDQLQREIAEYRTRLDRKFEGLETRLRDDVRQVRQTAADDVGGLGDRVQLRDHIERRPMTSLAAAFAGGVLLGMFGPDTAKGAASGVRSAAAGAGSAGGGMANDLLGGVSGLLGISLQDEVRAFVRDLAGRDHGEQRGSAEGYRPAAPRRAA